MARGVGWREEWGGARSGVARGVAWREEWGGQRSGVARGVGWREEWGGENRASSLTHMTAAWHPFADMAAVTGTGPLERRTRPR